MIRSKNADEVRAVGAINKRFPGSKVLYAANRDQVLQYTRYPMTAGKLSPYEQEVAKLDGAMNSAFRSKYPIRAVPEWAAIVDLAIHNGGYPVKQLQEHFGIRPKDFDRWRWGALPNSLPEWFTMSFLAGLTDIEATTMLARALLPRELDGFRAFIIPRCEYKPESDRRNRSWDATAIQLFRRVAGGMVSAVEWSRVGWVLMENALLRVMRDRKIPEDSLAMKLEDHAAEIPDESAAGLWETRRGVVQAHVRPHGSTVEPAGYEVDPDAGGPDTDEPAHAASMPVLEMNCASDDAGRINAISRHLFHSESSGTDWPMADG